MIFDTLVNGQEVNLPCTPGGENIALAVRGDHGAIAKEVGYFVERSALVAGGLFLAGFRGERVWKGALAAGLTMELFVVGYSYYRNRKTEQ